VAPRDPKLALLEHVPLFAQCSRKELKEIAGLADEVDLKKGYVMTQENDAGREFLVLVEGSADVRRRGRKINVMGPGDFFGEIALVADRPRTATVVATSDVRALVITARSFQRLMRDMPAIQSKVLAAVVARLPENA
jgi:CRP-like cAMP-binding protein